MRLDRRRFLVLSVQAAGAAVVRSARAAAPDAPTARWIHQRTRNTRFGSLGAKLFPHSAPPPFKQYPERPAVALQRAPWLDAPPLGELLRAGEPGARDPNAADLGRILHLANGVTGVRGSGSDATRLRAAPSAGALYSNEIYVLAERVDGLASGLWYYDVLGDAWLQLRAGSQRAALAAALESSGIAEHAAAFVIHTNVFARYTWRYGKRGYRYALIDTGHVAENLELAARAAGVPLERVPRYEDDALHALLGVDGREEAVCALSALGGAVASEEAPRRALVERQAVGAGAARSAIERFHELTKLVPAPAGVPERPHCAPAFAAPIASQRAGRGGAAPQLSVDRAILARRSATRFSDEALPATELALLAEAALSRSHAARELLSLLAIVHRVDGVEPGLHRYDVGAGRILPLRAGDLRDALARACLGQQLAASAAAAFVVIADLAAIDASCGARGYRDALIESGRIAERIYLAAAALGRAARNLAAFTDDELNRLLELDGGDRFALHLTVIGAAPSDAAP